jgi:VIT1/CCC1 family predicted Fe2+/Mn2+ transporter
MSDSSSYSEIEFTTKQRKARRAHEEGDKDASRAAHELKLAPEKHKTGAGDYIKSIVFGGMDGVGTTFAVVSAVFGANLNFGTTLIMGFANLLGDGISMGMGDFLSERAEIAFVRKEQQRERWECDNYLEGEKREMVEIYLERGFAQEDAEKIVDIYTRKPEYFDAFVESMMVYELGLQPSSGDEAPFKNGLVTFASFMLLGVIPLIPYVITAAVYGTSGLAGDSLATFIISVVLAFGTMFTLGSITSRFTASTWIRAGLFMLANGFIVTAAAYLIGYAINAIIAAAASKAAAC